jgi:hypothetical protein
MVGGDDDQGPVVHADSLQPLDELTEKAVDEPGLQQVPLILLRHGPGLVHGPAAAKPCGHRRKRAVLLAARQHGVRVVRDE